MTKTSELITKNRSILKIEFCVGEFSLVEHFPHFSEGYQNVTLLKTKDLDKLIETVQSILTLEQEHYNKGRIVRGYTDNNAEPEQAGLETVSCK